GRLIGPGRYFRPGQALHSAGFGSKSLHCQPIRVGFRAEKPARLAQVSGLKVIPVFTGSRVLALDRSAAIVCGPALRTFRIEEGPMLRVIDETSKRRLTERVDMMTAINVLRSQGYSDDEMLVELVKLFYLDLDEFND